MNLRAVIVGLVVQVATVLAPAGARAQPATHSPLDPVRLAADFAPGEPGPLPVVPFEVHAGAAPVIADSVVAPADSLPPGSPRPVAPGEIALGPSSYGVLPVVGALVGGAIGAYGGAVLGLAFVDDSHGGDEWEDLTAAFLGATAGEVVLMPLGAHFGNGSRGSYWSALGGSLLGYAATLGLSFLGTAGTIVGLGIQTGLSVSAEIRSARHRAAEHAARAAGEAPPP